LHEQKCTIDNKRKLTSVGDKTLYRSTRTEARPTITLLSHLNTTICISAIHSHSIIYIFSVPKLNHLLSKGKQNWHSLTEKDTWAPD